MLVELRVRDLGVIADLQLSLAAGMTALTGETGAGKTLVVDAIELLVGGRADAAMVRAGAEEAIVEGRFVIDDDEIVLRRVVSAQGRSRAYVDGAMATVTELGERGALLVDLHGQHAHQSLLGTAAQRSALDAYTGIDLSPLREARAILSRLRSRSDELGGDPRERAREIDLLAFQVQEIAGASLDDPHEETMLETIEDQLANAVAYREAAALAYAAISSDGCASDRLRDALSAIAGRGPFDSATQRLRDSLAELDDIAHDLRTAAESIDEDPAALERVRARRQLLAELRRKYGASLDDVVAFGQDAERRLAALRGDDDELNALGQAVEEAGAAERAAAEAVASERRAAAPRAAAAIQAHARQLALARATVSIEVSGDPPADDVAFLFCANPGETALPLRKVVSGGELARVMLALRLVLTSGPPTMVFDEVDAGVGGEAAAAVGRALAELGDRHQVLVVTHLAQVAAFADAHVRVIKQSAGKRVVAHAAALEGGDRVVELSRMLAGDSDSAAAREHATELLDAGRKRRAG